MTTREQTLHFTAPDIGCAHCVTTITSTLGSIAGVRRVVASEVTKYVTVDIDPAQVDEKAIRDALYRAGYPAST